MTSIGRAPPLDAPPSLPTRLSSDLKPMSSRNSFSGSGGMPFSARSSSGSGSGLSQTSSTSLRDRRAISACSIRFCLSLGLVIWSVDASTVSRSPYCWISWVAVLGPMPGTPGTLSTLSPISASTSPTFSGGTPNFSSTSVAADPPVVHRVEHVDLAVVDQLHQILVGADDGHLPAGADRGIGVAGDDVVGLQPILPRCRGSKRRGSRRGSAGIAGPGPRAAAAGSPCTGRTSCCGGSPRTHRGSPPYGSARRPCSSPSASFHSMAV